MFYCEKHWWNLTESSVGCRGFIPVLNGKDTICTKCGKDPIAILDVNATVKYHMDNGCMGLVVSRTPCTYRLRRGLPPATVWICVVCLESNPAPLLTSEGSVHNDPKCRGLIIEWNEYIRRSACIKN